SDLRCPDRGLGRQRQLSAFPPSAISPSGGASFFHFFRRVQIFRPFQANRPVRYVRTCTWAGLLQRSCEDSLHSFGFGNPFSGNSNRTPSAAATYRGDSTMIQRESILTADSKRPKTDTSDPKTD